MPLIVKGKVISIDTVSIESTMSWNFKKSNQKAYKMNKTLSDHLKKEAVLKIELEVIRTFKSKKQDSKITLYTSKSSYFCGFTRFVEQRDYIVYAFEKSYLYKYCNDDNGGRRMEKENTWWTSICTRTKEYNSDEEQKLETLIRPQRK